MTSATKGPSPRATLLAVGTAAAFVVVPFLFWRGTWFGRPLTDAQIDEYLNDDAKPRHIQHALAQISPRIERGDRTTERWYPRIAHLARHPVPELRVTAAWAMGQDNRSDAFHQALAGMLRDPEPVARRNAALGLARFNDPAARPELRAMLRSYTLPAPHGGALRFRLKVGDPVGQGTLLARVDDGEIRSPLPGKLERKIATDGARVAAGDHLLALEPSADHVWEALRALYLVGTPEDLPDVDRFTQPRRDWPERIAEQARLTAGRLRK